MIEQVIHWAIIQFACQNTHVNELLCYYCHRHNFKPIEFMFVTICFDFGNLFSLFSFYSLYLSRIECQFHKENTFIVESFQFIVNANKSMEIKENTEKFQSVVEFRTWSYLICGLCATAHIVSVYHTEHNFSFSLL